MGRTTARDAQREAQHKEYAKVCTSICTTVRISLAGHILRTCARLQGTQSEAARTTVLLRQVGLTSPSRQHCTHNRRAKSSPIQLRLARRSLLVARGPLPLLTITSDACHHCCAHAGSNGGPRRTCGCRFHGFMPDMTRHAVVDVAEASHGSDGRPRSCVCRAGSAHGEQSSRQRGSMRSFQAIMFIPTIHSFPMEHDGTPVLVSVLM